LSGLRSAGTRQPQVARRIPSSAWNSLEYR
jgi:hypothetical protein